ncbi:MAG TPA: hypothetical protein VNR00_12035 [Opitutus sp.]|nr:hypothetical protein [Opitutus sp.]
MNLLMDAPDPALLRQLPLIQKIIEDETRLEGERRGCPVGAWDPIVRERVCLVILRTGGALRLRALGDAASSSFTDRVL